MKSFIASDFHGKNPCSLVKDLVGGGEVNRAVFLGDYDEPRILEDIMSLDVDKVVLTGNHDYNLAHGEEVYSQDLYKPIIEYLEMWKDGLAGKFVRENSDVTKGIRKGIKVVRRHGGKRVLYLHGCLVGSFNETPTEVWGRILHDNDGDFSRERRVICNFCEMKKAGYWTMFRGHDHFPVVFSTNKREYSENLKQIKSSIDNEICLGGEDMNIVSVGAFVEGSYVLFDDESGKVEFKYY